jgi:uncharacterized protein (DUF1778 family)
VNDDRMSWAMRALNAYMEAEPDHPKVVKFRASRAQLSAMLAALDAPAKVIPGLAELMNTPTVLDR